MAKKKEPMSEGKKNIIAALLLPNRLIFDGLKTCFGDEFNSRWKKRNGVQL